MVTKRDGLARALTGLAIVLTFGSVAVASACAAPPTPDSQPSDVNLITEAEIDSAHVSTAYDVIHKLRPQYLIARGKLSLDPAAAPSLPRVYVDDQFYGDATTLRGILTGVIESIRFYSAADAQFKYGHDNAAGVIAIVTKH